ncbi:hypothetical protein [Streptomyces sp. NPDC007100]|uniref:hypothetical protein n=1 Tax=Streptomyces sp. NPDC007100 TaxID=3155602 RepID=UPI0033FBDB6E
MTTKSDWRLSVEPSAPFEGYDMAEAGRVEVRPIDGETPFARHLGETVLAVREEGDADNGLSALEITFESGLVRCASWSGDLSLRRAAVARDG